MKKFIAILLSVILVATFALPTVAFATAEAVEDEVIVEEEVAVEEENEHTTPEEFWNQMTNEDGSINWSALPKFLFNAALIITIFDYIATTFRNYIDTIFGTFASWMPDFEDEATEDVVEVESEVALA